ncbi:MAG: putative toxin-antitoxin system toxin component, PIN family [Thermomicrobiales bacterium]|nr:putative toxin-antitoxin system toxin component, PIN family [Thermomicrobiales bacterium]
MLRVVLDTNILVSALISSAGSAAAVVDCWRERRFLLLSSDHQIDELLDVVSRPRLTKKFPAAM